MGEVIKSLIGNKYLVKYAVGHTQAGTRLDRFLMARYRKRSREQLKRAIDSGAITVSREGGPHLHLGRLKPSFALQMGDVVHVLSTRSKEPDVNFNYRVLYEDEAILVIDKPANLPVHPAGRFFFNTLLTHLKTRGFTNSEESLNDYYLVHRIDKETSGILLLAKTRAACNHLTLQFRNRETDKYYLAIAHGAPSSPAFDVADPIGKREGSPIGLKIYRQPEENGGWSALTHFELVETRGKFSLLACFPRTGRQHQIRVHADLAGLPLVGDKLYGMAEEDCLVLLDHHKDMREFVCQDGADEEVAAEGAAAEDASADDADVPDAPADEYPAEPPKSARYLEIESTLLIPRHALHAAGLRFKHPVTEKEMVFECGLPPDLRAFFEGVDGRELQPFKTKHW